MDAFDFYVAGGFGRPHPVPVSIEPPMPDVYSRKDNYQFYLQQGADKNLLRLAGDSIAFFKELYEHPNRDNWWKARNARVAQYNIKPAMLVVGGLFDAEDCFGAWAGGQTAHAGTSGAMDGYMVEFRDGQFVVISELLRGS